MKKIVSILLMLALLIQSTGVVFAESELTLSDTTKVNVENTDSCFAKAAAEEKFSGDYSLHFKAGASDWLEVSQNLTEGAIAGGQYVITVVAKAVSGTVWFRVGWDDNGWLSSSQTDMATDVGNGWKKYVKTVTLKANQTNFLFHNDGAAEFYIDDISLVKVGETENLLPDGGFDEVTGGFEDDGDDEPAENIPDENLTLSDTTKVNVNSDNCFAKATDDEKASGDYSLHFKTNGDWLEVSQNLTGDAKAGQQYVITACVKPIKGTVWFRVGWDDTGWLSSTQSDFATELEDGWFKFEKTVTLTADQNTILFHNDGATEFYIDDIALVKVGDNENLIPDGGFEEVTVKGSEEPDPEEPTPEEPVEPDEPEEPTPDEPEEDVPDRYPREFILSDTTIITGANGETCYAEVTDDEFHGDDGYSLHIVSSGDVNFMVKQETVAECEARTEYLLTVYAKPVKGMLWFRIGWGEDAWMVAPADAEVQEDGWCKYEKTLVIDANNTTELFFYCDQESEFYVDDITIVKVGETENLVPDGGFEEVTVIEPIIPDYEVFEPVLKLRGESVDSVADLGEYTLSVNVKNNSVADGLDCEVLVAVFDASDEMLNLYSSAKTVEMTELNDKDTIITVPFEITSEGCSADVYVINNRGDFDTYYNPVKF